MQFPKFAFTLMLALWGTQAISQTISPVQAKDHLGQVATVCGHVASTHFAVTSRGKPTFINLDRPYPNQIFTILIWGSDRSKFGAPEQLYNDKNICIQGNISSYRRVPEIIAYEPSQIMTK